MELLCPECKSALHAATDMYACSGGHTFRFENGVINLMPATPHETVQGDADYHASQREDWIDATQLLTQRNLHFHTQVVDFVASHADAQTNILEIGGGVGFDLELFLRTGVPYANYVFSEIAEPMVSFTRQRLQQPDVFFSCIDAHNIPFAASTFDFVTMVATLHHFPDLPRALDEIARVLKPGGYLICGIEPNKRWVKLLVSLRGVYRRLMPAKKHSPADEEADGFYLRDLQTMGQAQSLQLVMLTPVWFLNGFAHYGLEFIYRVLRLPRRIRLPFFLERLLIKLDGLFFALPSAKNLAWHYTVVYQKAKNT